MGELSELHRNYIGAAERAERTPSIVAADRLARALETSLAEMFAEVERGSDTSREDLPLKNYLEPEEVFFLSTVRGSCLLRGVQTLLASTVRQVI